MLTVVALGGNALMRPGERGTAAEQRANLRETCEALRPLLDGDLVVTHGNGPQVGNPTARICREMASSNGRIVAKYRCMAATGSKETYSVSMPSPLRATQ